MIYSRQLIYILYFQQQRIIIFAIINPIINLIINLKERFTIRLKRTAFLASLALCATAATSLVAAAATDSISKGGVTLEGYVSGVEGPTITPDKVFWNAYVYEPDVEYLDKKDTEVYIEPGTDTNTLDKVYLHKGRKVVSGEKLCGYGGSEARMRLRCGDNFDEYTVISEPLI